MKGSDKSFKSFFNFTVFIQFFSCAAVSFGSFCPAHELSVMCREKTARNKVFKVLFFFFQQGVFQRVGKPSFDGRPVFLKEEIDENIAR